VRALDVDNRARIDCRKHQIQSVEKRCALDVANIVVFAAQAIDRGRGDRHHGRQGKLYVPPDARRLELRPVVELLGAWGHRWARSNLNKGDLDAGLLMWDMRRTVDPAVFPGHRIVVQFEYPDAPKGERD
jgi:hypothetical protein